LNCPDKYFSNALDGDPSAKGAPEIEHGKISDWPIARSICIIDLLNIQTLMKKLSIPRARKLRVRLPIPLLFPV